MLAAAAVLGEAFDVETLSAVSGVGDDALLSLLEEAAAEGLVEEVGAGRYRFSHALTRDAVHAGLGPSRRARLHRSAAEALAARQGLEPGPQLVEIALHRCEAAVGGDGVRTRSSSRSARRAGRSRTGPTARR